MTINADRRIAARRAKRNVLRRELEAEADRLDAIAADALNLAERSTESARQKRATAQALADHTIDINDLKGITT